MIIGIDPGMSGGIASVRDYKMEAHRCPQTALEMASLFRKLISKPDSLKVYVENVHAFPTDARSSAFKFGRNFGMWLGIIGTFGIEPYLVSPMKWQKHYGQLPKIKKERKQMLKQMASDLVIEPFTLKGRITLSTADAILIARYGTEQCD